MEPRVISAREHVIRRNIDIIRESLIERQLEAEFLEGCIAEAQPKMAELYDKIVAMGGFPSNEDEALTAEKSEALQAYSSAQTSIETMISTLNEHRAVEAALSRKLKFYKSKRQVLVEKNNSKKKKQKARFVEEGLEYMYSAPDKINVNTDCINFKKGGK